jgi:hypothetical protein
MDPGVVGPAIDPATVVADLHTPGADVHGGDKMQ